MSELFLYDNIINEFGKRTIAEIPLPDVITDNINPKFKIRAYQLEAFQRFICYNKNEFSFKNIPIHLLFNMATGSGKTLMMAGLILCLYQKGYRNFLFFVDSTNIVQKTKDNFLNKKSSKYLFNERIFLNGKEVFVNEVDNFNQSRENDINIFFTTIQGLHQDLNLLTKENAITYDDFRENEIVLLSDEAHHINVKTSNKNNHNKNWEETVQTIFSFSEKNILLEFTATIDLSIPEIKNKYLNKIVYKYDLLHFRKDKFSKEIKTLSLDSSLDQVMLHAVLLSQYRLKIAEKNHIFLKPVILFKAQRTIKESNENESLFKKIIDQLSFGQLEKLLNISFLPKKNTVLQKAFSCLEQIYRGNYEHLISELKQEFSDEKILNVNDEHVKKDNQLLLNSLEDKDNPIRAIFAVNKLNEGWDVLNLFDIVRLYDTRDGKWQSDGKYQAGKSTLSEAQLIGRGARYYPFSIDNEDSDADNHFQRKYDEDIHHELKILEELHYHSKYNSRYLEELDKALIEQGLIDDKSSIKKEKIKVVDENFYDKKIVFKNKRITNDNQDKNSFKDYQIPLVFSFMVATNETKEKAAFHQEQVNANATPIHRIDLKTIHKRIFLKAFNQNKDFWTFGNLKKIFGQLSSVDDLLHENFFYGLSVESNAKDLSNENKLALLNHLLGEISKTILKNAKHKKGTTVFYPHPISKYFKTIKELKFDKNNSQFKNIDIDQIKEYFLHDKLIGSSEEENFINFFKAYLEELLKKYREVKLVRNNRELKLYRFDDGEAFEPDFILFLTKKNGEEISYQVFIEAKGNHLLEYDKKKETFLKQIQEKYSLVELLYTKDKYKLLGLKFYNKTKEDEFKKDFENNLIS